MVVDLEKEWEGTLERGGRKSWNALALALFRCVSGYPRRNWNKEKEVAMPLCVKRLLNLSDAELVANPQEGCCYCLGVGEACWKKSVVWGNVKQVCLVLIRREGILSWLKILPNHHWELNVLSRRTSVTQCGKQQIYKQQLQGSAAGHRLRGHLWLMRPFHMRFPSLKLISWG